MASKTARPGRRLIIFALVVAALYGGVALGGEWKPKLGLDLQGGTRITLEASTDNGQKPSAASLEEARGIIDQRVNGTGVAEAEVATQGGRNIVVEIPGANRKRPRRHGEADRAAAVPAGRRGGAPASRSRPARPARPRAAPRRRAAVAPAPSERPVRRPEGVADAPRPRAARRSSPAARTPTRRSRRSPRPRRRPSARQPVAARPPPSASLRRRTRRVRRSTSRCSGWTTRARSGCRSSPRTPARRARRRPRRSNDNKSQPLVTCDEDGNKLLLSSAADRGHPAQEAPRRASRRTRSSGSST